jgi:hypothetical protein
MSIRDLMKTARKSRRKRKDREMMMYEPKETYYNGFKYRSRTEARWAYLFDLMGIKYEPERQGYKGHGGIAYLSDFVLPDFGVSVEVKGRQDALMAVEKKLCASIYENATPAASGLILLKDIPYYECTEEKPLFTTFPMLYWDGKQICLKRVRFAFSQETYLAELPNVISTSSDLTFPKGTRIDEQKDYNNKTWCRPLALEHFAYLKARSAQFEFGKTPHGKKLTWEDLVEFKEEEEAKKQKEERDAEERARLRASTVPKRRSVIIADSHYKEA